jgi:phenylpyruvate tautomerase PptA (4-oxalocrotonate tautomerase family)
MVSIIISKKGGSSMSDPTVILQEQGENDWGLGGTRLTEEDQKRYEKENASSNKEHSEK